MPKSKYNPIRIQVYCRNCFTTFNGTRRGNSILCGDIRQHIQKRKECFEAYRRDDLVSCRGIIDLHSSIDQDIPSPGKKKRKAPNESSNTIPPPKRVMICELNPLFLQENFGSHAATHALLKGESFAQKSSFTQTQNWKPPNNKLMNDFFCNANISFNHFSKNAILLDPKIDDLKIPDPVTSLHHPTEVMVALNDDFSYLSSILVEPPLDFDNNPNVEEDDDHISLESDDNVDDGSVHNEEDESTGSTQRMENLVENQHNTNNNVEQGAAVIHETLRSETSLTTDGRDLSLLNRWVLQREKNTIRHGIAPDPVVVSELSLLHLQHKHGLSLEAVKAVKEWAYSSYMS